MKPLFLFMLFMPGFISTCLATKDESEIIWKKILQANHIVRVQVEAIDYNKAKVRQTYVLKGNDNFDIRSVSISKGMRDYHGREWIKANGDYFLLLYNSQKNQHLHETFDKIRIENDSLIITSYRLIGLKGDDSYKKNLYSDTDPGDRIGLKIPVAEFELVVTSLSQSFRFSCGKLKLKKGQTIQDLKGKNHLLDLLLANMTESDEYVSR